MISNLDLKLLKVFKTVVESGGFSAAEVDLHISRSAISRYMSDLEARLDMCLCYRGRAGFSLTDQGRQVYNHLQQLDADLEKFRANINLVHGHLAGDLRLGLTDNTITDPSSKIILALGKLKIKAPQVRFTLETSGPNEVERGLLSGSLHVGVLPYHQRFPGLSYIPLYRETSHLYGACSHPFFSLSEKDQEPASLTEFEFVAPAYKTGRELTHQQIMLTPTSLAYNMEGVASLILSGRFIGFLPDHYAHHWVERSIIAPIHPTSMKFTTQFMAATKAESQANPLRDAFLNELLAT